VLLSDGRVTQSQALLFDDPECVHLPVLLPTGPASAVASGVGEDSDCDDDAVASDVAAAPPLAAAEPLPADNAVAPAALLPVQPHSLLEMMQIEGACMSELVWITV
jgi:hypothetical protein